MKKILLALGLTFAAMSSQAALTFTPAGTTVVTNDVNNITGDAAGTTYSFGTLSAAVGDVIQFTNVSAAAEAFFINFFINDSALFQSKSNVGTFTYEVTTAGPLSFSFKDQPGVTFLNGSDSIGVLANASGFLLLLNDSGNGTDFDDHAVQVSAVPVPAALPLMASALGAFGIARRRSNKAKAV